MIIAHSNFDGSTIRSSKFSDIQIIRSSFRGTKFSQLDFNHVIFDNMDFTTSGLPSIPRTDFSNAVFAQVHFDNHNITPDDLKAAMLCNTEIDGHVVDRDCVNGRSVAQ